MISPDKRRKILFLLPTLRGGGAERVIVTLLRHLDRSKFRLSLAVVDTTKAVYLNDLPDDVEFIDLGCTRVRYALPKIIALIWKRRPDVVFSTLGHMNLALAMVKPLFTFGVRFVARESNIVSCRQQVYRFPKVWLALYRYFYKNHDLVVCQTHAMQSDLVSFFAFPEDKTIVINNPIDMDTVHRKMLEHVEYPHVSVGTIKLIAAGRMSAAKGYDLLIEAFALLNDQRIHLTLLGEGPLDTELKQLAGQYGVAGQIYFAGFQANPYAWFAKADAFVLSSRYEGFPNVVLEALACGTPVIAAPTPGGVCEILDNITGSVVAQSVTAEALAVAISQWIDSERMRISEADLSRYDIPYIIEQYQNVLMSI